MFYAVVLVSSSCYETNQVNKFMLIYYHLLILSLICSSWADTYFNRGGSDCKKSAFDAGDPDLIPRSGRRRAWQPIPVFLTGNSIDRGAWQAKVHGIAKSRTWLSTHSRKKKKPQRNHGSREYTKCTNTRLLCPQTTEIRQTACKPLDLWVLVYTDLKLALGHSLLDFKESLWPQQNLGTNL